MVHLHLRRNSDLFHPMAVAMEIDGDGNHQQHPINAHQFYTGHISEHNTSHVRAHVSPTGVLTAAISMETDVIYIEPANKYLDESPDGTMVVYKNTDMLSKADNQPVWFCEHASSASHPAPPPPDVELTDYDDVELRRKRSASNNNTELVCLMHLVADYQFFINHGQRSVSNTIIYLAVLVDTADNVFRNTVWEHGVTGYGLQVGNITIHCSEGGVSYNHPTSPSGDKWTAQTLLKDFSYNDWSEYCLAHLFTYYEFPHDTLGFAYVASKSTGNLGGICSSYRRSSSNSNIRTTNVGLSSFANLFGKQLLQPQAEHIFTHEVGHNWGSYHDLDTAECNPPFVEEGGRGKYVMYPSVLTGIEPNNKVFSNCSRRRVALVLRTKSFCFIQRTQAICGNHRIDPGEKCDAGLLGCMNMDDCCHDNCTLKTGAVCSDQNEQCCQQCQPTPANSTICANQSFISCTEDVYCNGNNVTCPPTTAKRSGSECIDDGQCSTDPVDGSGICLPYCNHTFDTAPCICGDDSQQCFFCCYNTTYGGCVAVTPTKYLPDGRPCEGGVCLNVSATSLCWCILIG
ncbi:disintegrin and metalloproteinase domain-containing protein 17-like isoform X2 [Dysidea avara]